MASNRTISTNIPSYYGTIFIVISRLTCLAYIVLAGFTFPEVQKLLSSDYKIEGETYYVPIAVCEPGALNIDPDDITYDVNNIDGCRTMNRVVTANAASLLMSAFATFMYIIIDIFSRCHVGPFNHSSVSGMGLFLLFIVFQSASSTWALAEESDFWSDYMSSQWEDLGLYETYGVTRVHTYCNETLLWFTGGVGAFACVLVLFESLSNLCCTVGPQTSDDEDDEEKLLGAEDSGMPEGAFDDVETGKYLDETPSAKEEHHAMSTMGDHDVVEVEATILPSEKIDVTAEKEEEVVEKKNEDMQKPEENEDTNVTPSKSENENEEQTKENEVKQDAPTNEDAAVEKESVKKTETNATADATVADKPEKKVKKSKRGKKQKS